MVQSNSSYIELSEKVSAAEGQITQRLKWNAGANPKLASVLTRFEAAQAARSSLLQVCRLFIFLIECIGITTGAFDSS